MEEAPFLTLTAHRRDNCLSRPFPGPLLHVFRGRPAARLRLGAMLAGVFNAGDDFVQRRLNPLSHQLSLRVVDGEAGDS